MFVYCAINNLCLGGFLSKREHGTANRGVEASGAEQSTAGMRVLTRYWRWRIYIELVDSGIRLIDLRQQSSAVNIIQSRVSSCCCDYTYSIEYIIHAHEEDRLLTDPTQLRSVH